MATSTFGKRFIVDENNARSFCKAISQPVAPTLDKTFKSYYTNLSRDNVLRSKLSTVLGR